MKNRKCRTLIIDWGSLPDDIAKEVQEWHGFNKDCLLPVMSELSEPADITQFHLEEYFNDQVKDNGFKGTIDDFIKEYGLVFPKYLIDQKIDLSDVDLILIDICW